MILLWIIQGLLDRVLDDRLDQQNISGQSELPYAWIRHIAWLHPIHIRVEDLVFQYALGGQTWR